MNPAAAPPLPDGFADYLQAARVPRREPPLSLEEQRLLADRNASLIAIPRPAGMTVTDSFVVGGGRETPIRIYRPHRDATSALVYFHGGGFTTGSIETYDPLAASLAEASGVCVISVGYRRLPEASPRAILDEAAHVLEWAVTFADQLEVDAGRIGVGGDSAGATIAAMLAARGRSGGAPAPACQALLYGIYDVNPAEAPGPTGDPVLSSQVLEAILATYRECDAREPLEQPLPARDGAAGLPPTVMLHAALDPLRAQGESHARRLEGAGVRLTARTAPGMPHGFLRAIRFSQAARDEMRLLGQALAQVI